MAPAKEQSEKSPTELMEELKSAGDSIDMQTFEQVLEMDDDESEREFSKSIVFDFFQQAETTFGTMDKKLDEKDLRELSSLGHFLKGSSATLGLSKVRDCCEEIQNLGSGHDKKGDTTLSEDECLEQLPEVISECKIEFAHAKKMLSKFYQEDDGDD